MDQPFLSSCILSSSDTLRVPIDLDRKLPINSIRHVELSKSLLSILDGIIISIFQEKARFRKQENTNTTKYLVC